MKAIIPVAGYGTRLAPHTNKLQKCLFPVGGKPVLEHILDRLVDAGIIDVTLIIGHLGDQVKYFSNQYKKAKITLIEQKQQLGLAHAISLGLDSINKPVVIALGDSILDLNYKEFINSNHSTIGVHIVSDPKRFGIVELEGKNIMQ